MRSFLVEPRRTFAKTELNRRRGRSLWFRVEVEGGSRATAWREVFPESDCTDKSAADLYSRFMRWYKETYPPVFDEIAEQLGLTPEYLVGLLRDMTKATIWKWDSRRGMEVDTGRPDHKTRAAGYDRVMKLVEKSEDWRRKFIEAKDSRPTRLDTPPEFDTPEEFEKWARKQDVIGEIERKRQEALAARDRRLKEQGRPVPSHRNGKRL